MGLDRGLAEIQGAISVLDRPLSDQAGAPRARVRSGPRAGGELTRSWPYLHLTLRSTYCGKTRSRGPESGRLSGRAVKPPGSGSPVNELRSQGVICRQIDSCRLGGVNEILAVLLLAAKFEVPVCPHAGGVGLCEHVQRLPRRPGLLSRQRSSPAGERLNGVCPRPLGNKVYEIGVDPPDRALDHRYAAGSGAAGGWSRYTVFHSVKNSRAARPCSLEPDELCFMPPNGT